jgi:pimeloyl-ACP methyl ester carboxylesterase
MVILRIRKIKSHDASCFDRYQMNASEPVNQVVEINGTRTACASIGSGPPLLLLHGAEGSRRSFEKVAPLLSPHFTVISYDQRDCGETENPPAPVNLQTLADDARALLLRLGHARAMVFGTSFGGRLAQMLALTHPECVERLLLASTWSIRESLVERNPDVVLATHRLRGELPQSAEQLAAYFFPEQFLEAHPGYKSHFKSAPNRSERSQRRSATVSEVCAIDPARIASRTLVLAGELDVLVPAALSKELALSIPGARFVLLEALGHIGHVQAPEKVAAQIHEFCMNG